MTIVLNPLVGTEDNYPRNNMHKEQELESVFLLMDVNLLKEKKDGLLLLEDELASNNYIKP